MILHSPLTGQALVADTPHSLAAMGERWPVVDGIAYLRTGRQALVDAALGHLDAGRSDAALIGMLADQDGWWTGPLADPDALAQLVAGRHTLSLRAAMALLGMGPVATYFAYRWADPTYLAGLALIEAHWPHPAAVSEPADRGPATAFELACGIGHYLRELTGRGIACTGGDVVFAKCWLARHWVAPDAEYVVFDADAAWPLTGARFDLVTCHDAFYFLGNQPEVASRLRSLLAPGGVLAVSHLHNAAYRGGAKGPAREAAAWRSLFPAATVYDEAELLGSLMHARAPRPQGWRDGPEIEAWSLVEGAGAPRALSGGLAMPHPEAALRANPLLRDGVAQWPSERWRDEYAAGCWWAREDGQLGFAADPVRLRRLVDLPARW